MRADSCCVKLGIACGFLVVLSGVAGCGQSELTVHSQSARQISAPKLSLCETDWKTLAIASEAFSATTGRYPSDQSQLVVAGLLQYTIDSFDYSAVDGFYVLTGVGDCARFDPDISSDAGPPPTPEVSGCDAEHKMLETAWDAYNAEYGKAPASEMDLVDDGLLFRQAEGWDLIGTDIVPVTGMCD
jgi:hypothetical protein